MATIQSIQDVLKTYQQAYGAEALMAQLSLFQKSSSVPSSSVPAPAAEAPKSATPLSKLTNQELRDIWADLTGRQKGLKSSGKLTDKKALVAEIERLRSLGGGAAAPAASAPAPAPEAEKKHREPSAWAKFCSAQNPLVVALYKELFSAEKVPQGFPMRVCGLLKERGQTEAPSEEQLTEAIRFLAEHPDHKSRTQMDRHSDGGSVSGAESAASAEHKKRGRPPMSPEQKAQKEAEKAAKKDAEKAAKKADRAAKKALKKAQKEAAKIPLPASDDEAEAEKTLTKIELYGEDYYWDEEGDEGAFFAIEEDGSVGEQVGTYDGITVSYI